MDITLSPWLCALGLLDWCVLRAIKRVGRPWHRVIGGLFLGHLWAQAAFTFLTFEHHLPIYMAGFATLGLWGLGNIVLPKPERGKAC